MSWPVGYHRHCRLSSSALEAAMVALRATTRRFDFSKVG
jgi:hypothetical protein